MYLLDVFCHDTVGLWQTVGKVLVIFKIVIPLLLIIFGMIDLGKAVIGSKEDDIKKATSSLIRRAIAAIVIFFIPYVVSGIFGLVSTFQKQKDAEGYDVCQTCLTNPNGVNCQTYVTTYGN